MHIIDYLIVFCVIIIGFCLVWRLRRKITFEDFIIADRSVNAKHFLSTYVATNVSVAGILVAMSAATYQYGFHTLWGAAGWIAGTLLFLPIAIKKREFFARSHTLQEFLKEGYNSRTCQVIAALLMIILFWGSIAVGLLAITRVFNFFTPFALAIAFFAIAIAVFYTAIGGYKGILITDVFQIILLGIVLLVIPFLLLLHGGAQPIITAFENPPISQEPGWLIALGFLIMFVPFQIVAPDMWIRTAASKNTKEAIKGMLWSLIIFSLLFLIVFTIGIWAYHNYPGLLPDSAFSSVIGKIAPIGLLGLILGGIIVAGISTADTCLITIIQMLFYDVSGRQIKTKKLRKLRLVVIIAGFSAMLLPLLSPSIVDVLFAIFSCQLALLPSVLGIFFLKESRRHATGAIASILTGFVAGLLTVIFLKQAIIAPIVTVLISFVVYIPFTFFKKKNE